MKSPATLWALSGHYPGIIRALSGHYPGIIRALSARVSGLAGYSKCTVGQCITTARPVPGETSPLGWSAVVNVLQTLMKLRFDRSPELKNSTSLWHITLCTPCAPLCTPCARPVHTLCTPNTGLLSLASYVSFMFRIFCSCVKVDIFGKSRFLLFHSECMIFCSAVPPGTPPKVATVLQM